MFGLTMILIFSIVLIAYGYLALFRKDTIWRIREASARLEGKTDIHNREMVEQRGTTMGALSLIIGLVGTVLTIVMMYLTMT